VPIARWSEDDAAAVDADTVTSVLAEVGAASKQPIIVSLEDEGAELDLVVGDPSGTVLTYFPAGYADKATGSLHSVGDPEAARVDAWEPPLTAFFLGRHTEFPRWSVVAHDVGERAATEFCARPTTPPPAVPWEPD
jgi:hypothetical protein